MTFWLILALALTPAFFRMVPATVTALSPNVYDVRTERMAGSSIFYTENCGVRVIRDKSMIGQESKGVYWIVFSTGRMCRVRDIAGPFLFR